MGNQKNHWLFVTENITHNGKVHSHLCIDSNKDIIWGWRIMLHVGCQNAKITHYSNCSYFCEEDYRFCIILFHGLQLKGDDKWVWNRKGFHAIWQETMFYSTWFSCFTMRFFCRPMKSNYFGLQLKLLLHSLQDLFRLRLAEAPKIDFRRDFSHLKFFMIVPVLKIEL